MKTVVLGTSNSVMRSGWTQGLKSAGTIEVINLSIGRTPCLMHLSNMIHHADILQEADLILLDHSVNDVNYYIPRIGEKYFEYINDLIAFASSRETPVVNILFPIMGISGNKDWTESVLRIKKICQAFGVYYIDFNHFFLPSKYFTNKLHLKREVAFFVGKELASLLTSHHFKVSEHNIEMSHYKFLSYHNFQGSENTLISSFKNSLGEFKYFTLDTPVELSSYAGYEMTAIAYFNEERKTHTFNVKTSTDSFSYRTTGKKFFVELLDRPIPIDAATTISKTVDNIESIPPLMERNEPFYKDISGVNVSYIIFRQTAKWKLPERTELPEENHRYDMTPDIEPTIKLFEYLFFSSLSNPDIDALRDAAIELENTNAGLSLKLMSIAHLLRPNGQIIVKKLNAYRQEAKDSTTP